MRDKYVEERFPPWSAAGSEVDVMDAGCNGVALSGEAIASEHNLTVDALCDAVRRLSPEQQADWLAAWPIWRPPGRARIGPIITHPVPGFARFAPPPTQAALDLGDKVAQLVTDIGRERGRRLQLAALKCLARDQRPEELRIHTDAGGLELRAELIVAGEVAETVDLSDLHPERLWRDSGKPPA